jgi:hypothetical protein
MTGADIELKDFLFRLMLFLLLPIIVQACTEEFSAEKLALSDAPAYRMDSRATNEDSSISYAEDIQNWKTIAEVNSWIAENFRYDMQRARLLAGSSRSKISIYEPAEVFHNKAGVCVDLARFAFETIEMIDPDLDLHYLMVEFEPFKIGNSTFRRHWLVVYQKKELLYVLADSKRPGHLSGPYPHMADFIAEYQTFRKRKIISYKLTDTYRKKLKQKRKKQLKQIKPES